MNEQDQSAVAYEVAPKEVNTKRRMPSGDKQFGKVKMTMPQDEPMRHKKVNAKTSHVRHKEHR
jgi:hypothetical protein